jgi:hypothetical protein
MIVRRWRSRRFFVAAISFGWATERERKVVRARHTRFRKDVIVVWCVHVRIWIRFGYIEKPEDRDQQREGI